METRVIMVRLPADKHQAVKRLARMAGISMNDFMLEAVTAHLHLVNYLRELNRRK